MKTLAQIPETARAAAVAIAFRPSAPPGIPRVDHAGPSGCSYWRLAAEGKTFWTAAEDHQGCPVGAHTHGVPLGPAKMEELQDLIGVMASLHYLDPAEVPSIPARREPFGVALSGPYPGARFEPDVVLVACDARAAMLLAEAAQAAGVAGPLSTSIRPTCALLPATIGGGAAGLSLGCIGNRVYTGISDDQLYFAIPGKSAEAVFGRLDAIVAANRELATFHEARRAAAAAGTPPPGGSP